MLYESLLRGDGGSDVRPTNFTSLNTHPADCTHTSKSSIVTSTDHTSTLHKDLIIDTTADGALSLATSTSLLLSPSSPTSPTPSTLPLYTSLQRAREQSSLTLLHCLPLKPLLLVSICFLTFGSYWVYDLPGALSLQLAQWFGPSYTPAMNANLYSVYSYPNIVLPFFSGLIVDKYTGVRGGAFLFISLITVGHAIFCTGVQARLYSVALLGRFVFGLGGESLTVVQNTFIVRWFDGRYLALAFSLVLAFARVGTSINFIVSPKLAKSGVTASVWAGAGMTAISFLMCCAAAWLDYHAEQRIARERKAALRGMPAEQRKWVAAQDRAHEPKQDEVSIRDIRRFPVEAWLLFLITVFFYIGTRTCTCSPQLHPVLPSSSLVLLCVSPLAAGVLSFYTVAQDILTNTGRKYDADEADLYIAIPSFVSIVASPAFGFAIDKVGRALYWILVASCLLCVGHVMFLLMAYDVGFAVAMTPVPVMIWIGVAYAMGGAAVWPILSYVLEPRLCGTGLPHSPHRTPTRHRSPSTSLTHCCVHCLTAWSGYGAMTAIQNTGLALAPQIIAAIRGISSINGRPMEYVAAILIFIACTAIAGALTLLLMGKDRRSGKRLNATAEERARRNEEEVRAEGVGKMLPGEEEGVGKDEDGDGVDDRDEGDGVNSALDGNGVY